MRVTISERDLQRVGLLSEVLDGRRMILDHNAAGARCSRGRTGCNAHHTHNLQHGLAEMSPYT